MPSSKTHLIMNEKMAYERMRNRGRREKSLKKFTASTIINNALITRRIDFCHGKRNKISIL